MLKLDTDTYETFYFSRDDDGEIEVLPLKLKVGAIDITNYKKNGVGHTFLTIQVLPHSDDIDMFKEVAKDLDELQYNLERNIPSEEDFKYTAVTLPRSVAGDPMLNSVKAELRSMYYLKSSGEVIGVKVSGTAFTISVKL